MYDRGTEVLQSESSHPRQNQSMSCELEFLLRRIHHSRVICNRLTLNLLMGPESFQRAGHRPFCGREKSSFV